MSNSNNLISQFTNGNLTINEFAVMVAVATKANGGNTVSDVTTTEIAEDLQGGLRRNAVARALRNLQKKNFINWQTANGRTGSTIVVR